jgi:hypothetical protein
VHLKENIWAAGRARGCALGAAAAHQIHFADYSAHFHLN